MAEGFSLEHSSYPYHEYTLEKTYEWFSGEIAVPIAYVQGAAPPEVTAKSVNVSKAQGRAVLAFSMRRQGARPQIPDPRAVSDNEKLLKATLTLKDPKRDASGSSLLFEAEGRYEYLLFAPIFMNQTQYPAGKTTTDQRQPVGDLVTGGIDS